ncbi:HAD-IA family hydrolase [Candidatus Pacearchaeota archaeon]|nr:HAD-IA family hydrolase [Candidatus Pacearchaeota archaeon]
MHLSISFKNDATILQAWMRLVMLRIDDFFDVVVTAADVRKQKTSTAPFKMALRELGVEPNEAMMVGDRVERDVNTAKKLGLKTCYARYGERRAGKEPLEKGTSGADFELEDISDLLEITKKIE